MGCDIHSNAERRNTEGEWEDMPELSPFDWRSYGLYAFLADVRNYSKVTPISPRRGIPNDASASVKASYEAWDLDAHSASWLSIAELDAFNYDAATEDRRVGKQVTPNFYDGSWTAPAGEGRATTYREFLGEDYFDELARLKAAGAERIVFWFDN
jgi:hypothetical protein